MRIDFRLFGYRTFAVREEDALAFLEECQRVGFVPKNPKRCEKTGEIRFAASLFERRKIRLLKVAVREVGTGGLPILFRRLIGRPGLIFGIAAALFLLIFSHLFLWDIRVSGCESITEGEIEEALAAAGVYRGAFLPRTEMDGAILSVREKDERIGYLSINRRGTVAFVQLREAKIETLREEVRPANLIAIADGIVTLPMIYAGECLVREGDAVRAGQILAAGVTQSEKTGGNLTRAAGQVLAKTTHTYRVFVPFSYEAKTPEGRAKTVREINFFNKTIKLYKNPPEKDEKCDIIEETRYFTFAGVKLPIAVHSIKKAPYTSVMRQRGEREAWQIAVKESETLLGAEKSAYAILEKSVVREVSAEGVTLTTTIVAEENIAAVAEIETK